MAKKTTKKATKKAAKKKVTKKAPAAKAKKKTAAKKTTKKAAKKSTTRKTSSSGSSSSSSSFPTMEMDDRQDDFYTSPASDYGSVPQDTSYGSANEEGGSSSKVVFIFLVALFLIVGIVIATGLGIGGKKGDDKKPADKGKKITTPIKKPVKKTPPPAASGEWVTHTVKKGEFLGKIGKKYGVKYQEIMKINGLKSARDAKPGTVLKIKKKK